MVLSWLVGLVTIKIFVIQQIAFSHSETGVYFYRDPRFQNKVPGSTDGSLFLMRPGLHPEYICALLCQGHSACVSFFVTPEKCIGFVQLMTNHLYDSGISVPGSQYYEIAGPIHNIALGKPTGEGQFYVHYGHELRAYRSVDGIRDGNSLITNVPQSCFINIARKQKDRYMFVNLLDKYFIILVKIMVRETCCNNRFRKIAVSVGDDIRKLQQCYYYDPPSPPGKGEMLVMPCGKAGNYVEIRSFNPTSFSLCELEASGYLIQ